MSNKKRAALSGLCAAILLGSILFINYDLNAGCAGDCFSCHEKLKKEDIHQPLGTCSGCHKTGEQKLSVINLPNPDGCGNNCFSCHKEWPKNGYHAALEKCNDCHKSEKMR
ncbi:cytochrome c3 family protein [Calditerrivibrio nitroreducens]|uniref:Multiheme C-type cytochrome n=1 Tax=Calditerrivibrio nitroreducens (strain DSM 19672 / NBRC 101217 / Yu37-1) TaxID=768670 RepID=E4TER4_CALNY|nr:cytochrome c3 family protein [Calditerrivibrio nitroreducens]ADR19421.1 multiheme C-type cytochrome [Calditerrivibrio nitroreducens DSM 19672]